MNGGDQECLLLIIQTCHLNLLTFLFRFNLHSKCLWFKLFGILTGVYNWIKLTNPRNVVRNKVAKLLTYPPDFEHFFIEAALQSVLATACPAYLQTKPCLSINRKTSSQNISVPIGWHTRFGLQMCWAGSGQGHLACLLCTKS